MTNNQDMKLSVLLYKYMRENKKTNQNYHNKKEKIINMDYTFKEELKQHFREIS